MVAPADAGVFTLTPDLQYVWADGYWILALGVVGAVVGSFLNVVIYRLPIMIGAVATPSPPPGDSSANDARTDTRFNLIHPPSSCPWCDRRIPPWENVPIVSFLMLKGRCRGCGGRISWRYPFVEVAGAALAAGMGLKFGLSWQLLSSLVFVWALLCIAIIDLEHMLVPDAISLPLLLAGLIVNAVGLFSGAADAVFGAVGGYLSLFSIRWGVRATTGKDALGKGDFKLFAAIGAWLGWQGLPFVLFIACAVGGIFGIFLILTGFVTRQQKIPFAPALAFAGVVYLSWGPEVQTAYWALIGAP